MITTHSNTCDKCKRVNPISFDVDPPEAWRTVVLNRWKKICPSCFDLLAEQAGVAYSFRDLRGHVVVGAASAASGRATAIVAGGAQAARNYGGAPL
jgi:hypothetical protein